MSYTIQAGSRVHTLAPTGSTGLLNPGAAVTIDPDADRLGVTLTVEAIGATPSITWKLQVSLDELNWSDARYMTDAAETVVNAAIVRTTVGFDTMHVLLDDRGWRFIRLVVSANVNVTFKAEAFPLDRDA